ncbi:hypothetical protein FJ546_22080 [Mesorhizobium sp. B2-4-19]|uniref:hypothetical protein n=1 Tax=Mesorhizobium sp. B2-4-19 TaxID=2589930 RepID=UPI001128E8AF|nr:hypothetical protein [Mesorhizobium sp. B2-4-19]TPK59184.1 hypothetical protein FJ546_22080 [Mesorhizobium sp. B2-4-19]
MKFLSEKPSRLNMQALLRDHSRHHCALVLSTSDGLERNDRPFSAAVTNNFSIRRDKRTMIGSEGIQAKRSGSASLGGCFDSTVLSARKYKAEGRNRASRSAI